MATTTDLVKNTTSGWATNATGTSNATDTAETTTETEETTPSSAELTRQYLDNYNTNREQKIRDMYSGQKASTLAGLKSAYDQNLSTAEQARDRISPQYQESMNALSATYERQRRNNNMQAAANGLNTGAGSQMQLGQSATYQGQQGALAKSENEALNQANQNITDLRTSYQNSVAQAVANNDYQQAAALLDEYGAQYDRTMSQAKQLADYGDFSLYANVYGQEAADQMEKTWSLQNPDLAYNLGKLTADDYYKMTGRYPRGYWGGGGYSSGGGGGYSSSRDRAFYGVGHYDGYGNFVNDRTGQVTGSMTDAPGAGTGYLGVTSSYNPQQAAYRATR